MFSSTNFWTCSAGLVHRTLCVAVFLTTLGAAQDVIPLPASAGPDSTQENYPEKKYFSKIWNTEVVTNVTKPSLTVFKPSPEVRNGTALVICPGGSFVALVNSESNDFARYVAARGVTAFVLKYRLPHTGEDAVQEFNEMLKDGQKLREMLGKTVPLAVADGLAAVTYVRQHASEWGVSPDRVGIIGFSAGGAVTAGVAFHYLPESRPAFVAPIYAPALGFSKDAAVLADAPPMFVAAATDDELGLAPVSVFLYEKWIAAHKSAELHIYSKGGHGFAMRKQNLPVDHWIDSFTDWMELQGWLQKK